MASEFPGRPWLLKGALIVFGAPIPVPTNIIIFQYNPESMTRKLTQPGADQSGAGHGACLNAGDTRNVMQSPVESYSLAVELDAADQLEESDTITMAVGLHPALPGAPQQGIGPVRQRLHRAAADAARAVRVGRRARRSGADHVGLDH